MKLLRSAPFHKVHHRSKNPNPWSGLSFHPVEAAVYFSPSVVCLVAPWLFTPLMRRALHFGLMLAPCRGHHGYGLPELKADPSHYVHHVKVSEQERAALPMSTAIASRNHQPPARPPAHPPDTHNPINQLHRSRPSHACA